MLRAIVPLAAVPCPRAPLAHHWHVRASQVPVLTEDTRRLDLRASRNTPVESPGQLRHRGGNMPGGGANHVTGEGIWLVTN
eukprot:9471575-Pyramimonas_sp.AAC.1